MQQLLPRGALAAVTEPRFVPAAQAGIPDYAWVLGVVVDGRARAYDLNLLNSHEVVNDRVGEKSFAAVWWPLANTAVVYDRKHGDRELTFEASGALMDASLVMRDRETDSWWSIMTSSAIGGELAGADLVELPLGEKTTWGDWVARHPETLVLSVEGREHDPRNPYDEYFQTEETFRDLEIEDRRLAPKTPIYSFWLDGAPYAVEHRLFAGGRLFELPGGGRYALLHRPPDAPLLASSRAYLIEAAELDRSAPAEELLRRAAAGELAGARPLPGFDTFWYTWAAVNKSTVLLR